MNLPSALAHLQLPQSEPTQSYLNQLIYAYTHRVPWETASRIVKRANTPQTADCPRWPDEFWRDTTQFGTGGTCFESNYAFFQLLRALGYEGYLTINNMGESIGCHTAIIVWLAGQKWLVDVGMPLYAPLRLDPIQPLLMESFFHVYTTRPDTSHTYQIERDKHPYPNCFTLIDQPVSEADYRRAVLADYSPAGLFLDRLIITKAIDEVPWRFVHNQLPLHLETYPAGERQDTPLPDDPAPTLSQHFQLDQTLIATAYSLLTVPN